MKRKMHNLIIVLLILIILVLGILLIYIFNDKKKVNDSNLELKEELKSYMSKNNEQEEEIELLKAKEENEYCEYTQTFFYLGDYEYQADVPINKFIIMDKFQEHEPRIFTINTEKFNIDFKYKHNYEITFAVNNNDYDKAYIINIVETDKLGLDQVQETCKK